MTSGVRDRDMLDIVHKTGSLGSVVLPVQAESAHLAREWLGLIFDAWALPEMENAQLCVSELVANVVNHAANVGDELRITISKVPGRVRVDVFDQSAKEPEINRSLEPSESGNGLFLVDALSSEWGYHTTEPDEGKCVWFTFD